MKPSARRAMFARSRLSVTGFATVRRMRGRRRGSRSARAREPRRGKCPPKPFFVESMQPANAPAIKATRGTSG